MYEFISLFLYSKLLVLIILAFMMGRLLIPVRSSELFGFLPLPKNMLVD